MPLKALIYEKEKLCLSDSDKLIVPTSREQTRYRSLTTLQFKVKQDATAAKAGRKISLL